MLGDQVSVQEELALLEGFRCNYYIDTLAGTLDSTSENAHYSNCVGSSLIASQVAISNVTSIIEVYYM